MKSKQYRLAQFTDSFFRNFFILRPKSNVGQAVFLFCRINLIYFLLLLIAASLRALLQFSEKGFAIAFILLVFFVGPGLIVLYIVGGVPFLTSFKELTKKD